MFEIYRNIFGPKLFVILREHSHCLLHNRLDFFISSHKFYLTSTLHLLRYSATEKQLCEHAAHRP
jgi:hypothetical protein